MHFISDTKNSVGLAGCIEEVSHNAIAVYWNPLESSAKVIIFRANSFRSGVGPRSEDTHTHSFDERTTAKNIKYEDKEEDDEDEK